MQNLNSISFSNSRSHSAPTGHRRDTDGTEASNETPTAGTENASETKKHDHKTRMNTLRLTHGVHECNKNTCSTLSSISVSNSRSNSAPTGHRQDTDGTPASNKTRTAGTENTNPSRTHFLTEPFPEHTFSQHHPGTLFFFLTATPRRTHIDLTDTPPGTHFLTASFPERIFFAHSQSSPNTHRS